MLNFLDAKGNKNLPKIYMKIEMVCPLYNIIETDTKWNLYFRMQNNIQV